MSENKRLWRLPEKRWLLGIPLGGFLMFFLGVLALGAFNKTMAVTSTNEFCTGCHEMAEYTYPEYQASGHYSNRIGVRADCKDCHLPHDDWFAYTFRKATSGSKDVFYHLTGKIDTREKYDVHRLEMAEKEWRRMEKNGSAECRSCHEFDAMNLEEQERRAQRKHKQAIEDGESCISCHKGVAHPLPEEVED